MWCLIVGSVLSGCCIVDVVIVSLGWCMCLACVSGLLGCGILFDLVLRCLVLCCDASLGLARFCLS